MSDSNQGLQGGRKYVALPDTVEAALVHAHAGDHIPHPCDEWQIRPPSPVLCTTGLKKHSRDLYKDRMSKSMYYFTQI